MALAVPIRQWRLFLVMHTASHERERNRELERRARQRKETRVKEKVKEKKNRNQHHKPPSASPALEVEPTSGQPKSV